MRYRNDVIRSVLLHIRFDLGMMLARDYASWNEARQTLARSNNSSTKSQGSSLVVFTRCVRPFHNSVFMEFVKKEQDVDFSLCNSIVSLFLPKRLLRL